MQLGVVSIIVPFNWPVAILGAALPHALLAGNTVIVKPPLTAPLATARIVERIAEQLPPGVLNVVTGPDANMSALIANTDVAKVCFTGSVGGGKKMMLGNLIELQFGAGRNWPLGAALSITLLSIVMIALLVYVRNIQNDTDGSR